MANSLAQADLVRSRLRWRPWLAQFTSHPGDPYKTRQGAWTGMKREEVIALY